MPAPDRSNTASTALFNAGSGRPLHRNAIKPVSIGPIQFMGLIVPLLVACGDLRAATLHVANNGVDNPACGTQSGPCRSIGQAIANANAGDRVSVGPGTYGELDADGLFLGPGEEPGGPACGNRGVICISKPLAIESTHGAGATMFHMGLGVRLLVDGAVFGGPGKGFTLTGRDNILRFEPGTTGNSAIGNVLRYRAGLNIQGSRHIFAQNTLYDESFIPVAGTEHTVQENVVSSGEITGSSGIVIEGNGHLVTNNVVEGASHGILINSGSSGVMVRGNSFLGNEVGILLAPGAMATINGNNIFANNVASPVDGGNCGLINRSGAVIDATNNFWGAGSGPGPEPADRACDFDGSSTRTAPAALHQFAIRTPGGGIANASPVCSAAHATPNVLWPPNNQFVRVWIIGVADPDNDVVTIAITGITQDEPVNTGNGDPTPDAVNFGSSANIRAQRIGGGNGRVYRLQFSASDGKGGSCTGAATVGVPHSQRNQTPVDDGQLYNSTQP